MSVRRGADDAFAAQAAGVTARHVGGSAEFINKYKLVQRRVGELREPVVARFFDVGSALLGGID